MPTCERFRKEPTRPTACQQTHPRLRLRRIPEAGEALIERNVLLARPSRLVPDTQAEIVRHGGRSEPVSDRKYVHVVSEADSPVMQTWIKAKDGVYIAAAVRKPPSSKWGNGPFPAIIFFHGAPGGRGMDQLVGWSRGDHGGPAWERFLQEGYVVAVADYRGGDRNLMNTPSSTGLITAIDDGQTGGE